MLPKEVSKDLLRIFPNGPRFATVSPLREMLKFEMNVAKIPDRTRFIDIHPPTEEGNPVVMIAHQDEELNIITRIHRFEITEEIGNLPSLPMTFHDLRKVEADAPPDGQSKLDYWLSLIITALVGFGVCLIAVWANGRRLPDPR